MIYFKKRSDNLKSDVDRLDIDNLETTPVDLSKISNVVKKRVYITNQLKELMSFMLLILVIDLKKLSTM